MMSSAEILDVSSNDLYSHRINNAFLWNHDVEEIAQCIRSEDFRRCSLNCPPENEKLGRHVSDAIVQNSQIREVYFKNSCSIQELMAWINSRNTLVNMTNLGYVWVSLMDTENHDTTSELDYYYYYSAFFALLLTSTSLHSFRIDVGNECSDDVMSALSSYLRSSASLIKFHFRTRTLSEAAFTALCNDVALSTVQQFTLYLNRFQDINPEKTAAESLARMIMESSSLEEVTIADVGSTWRESMIAALKLTAPVRNMDFTFTQIENDDSHEIHLRIHRKWKPLILSANNPLAFFPHILEKANASPETSHGSADMIFYVLRQTPDLVPVP